MRSRLRRHRVRPGPVRWILALLAPLLLVGCLDLSPTPPEDRDDGNSDDGDQTTLHIPA